ISQIGHLGDFAEELPILLVLRHPAPFELEALAIRAEAMMLQLAVEPFQSASAIIDCLMDLMAQVADEGGVEAVAQLAELLLFFQQYVVAQAVVQVIELLA